MRMVTLLAVTLLALVPSLAGADATLVRFAGGIGVDAVSNAPGSAPVAATVNRCENVAPFVERNTNPVPLAANGNFNIDDVLSPPPPSSCATPVLLIRNAGNLSWFSAGIQKFNDNR